jgi:hypothetical protein
MLISVVDDNSPRSGMESSTMGKEGAWQNKGTGQPPLGRQRRRPPPRTDWTVSDGAVVGWELGALVNHCLRFENGRSAAGDHMNGTLGEVSAKGSVTPDEMTVEGNVAAALWMWVETNPPPLSPCQGHSKYSLQR